MNRTAARLAGYDSREAVQGLRGQWLQVPESDAVPLEEGEYYLYQLEGLQVFTDEGEELGELVQVMETGANNVFVVRGESGECSCRIRLRWCRRLILRTAV